MKTSLTKLTLLILLVCSHAANSVSQTSDSLAYYLEQAAKYNPTVLERFHLYEAALQKLPQVSSLPDPQLEMGLFLSPMELISGNQVAEIKLMQMLPWFGVLKNAKDEMSLMARAEYESFRDAKFQVSYDLQRNWYDLWAVRQKIQLTEKNIKLLKTIERLSYVVYRTGSIGGNTTTKGVTSSTVGSDLTSGSNGMNSMGENTGATNSMSTSVSSMGSKSVSSGLSDVYRIQIQLSDLENTMASLTNEEQVIRSRFNSLLNRSLTSAVNVPLLVMLEPLESRYLAPSDSLLAHNPMLQMLTFEQQSLRAKARMQKQMGMPMVGIGFNYSMINKSGMSSSAMNGKDMIMPMVSLSLPIYRKKYKAMQAETEYLKTAKSQSYEATANVLKTQYDEAFRLYNDASRRHQLYENQRLLTQKILDIALKSFSTSTSSLTEVLQISQQLLDFEQKKVEALRDCNQAKAWIKRLTEY